MGFIGNRRIPMYRLKIRLHGKKMENSILQLKGATPSERGEIEEVNRESIRMKFSW